MKKNILISTGGSGGHVVPAMILYDHLLKDTNVIISTDKRGLKYLDKDLYQFEIIDTPKLNNFFSLPLNIMIILFLTLKSFFLLRNKKIEKIFSTGGYMSLPVILAARFLKLNIYLLEPNQVLGRANKFFLKSCKKILCYTDQVLNFPENLKKKIAIINPLVREKIYKIKAPSSTNNKFIFLIVRGSQGASISDTSLKKIIVDISKKIPIKIIQQTNEKNVSSLSNFYSKNNVENKIFSFDKNLANSIQQTDVCITRAGASTLAELSVTNTPFIAIPLPTSKDNHQLENANFYKNNNCCWIIEQKYFDEKIEVLLKEILTDKTDFLKKKENLQKFNYQNSWISVNQKIIKTINEN